MSAHRQAAEERLAEMRRPGSIAHQGIYEKLVRDKYSDIAVDLACEYMDAVLIPADGVSVRHEPDVFWSNVDELGSYIQRAIDRAAKGG